MIDKKLTGLELLREPFAEKFIGKLPKSTKAQIDEVRADFKKGIRCQICNQWHHPQTIHLDYVGHAALTDRLLDCDPNWDWEPLATDEKGLPAFSKDGLWIKLTVCGVTRLGFGDSGGKTGGNAIKEIIGDALRNAAMRFGAALDLWHKGDLHQADEPETQEGVKNDTLPDRDDLWKGPLNKTSLKQALRDLSIEFNKISANSTPEFLEGLWKDSTAVLEQAIIDLPEWHAAACKARRKALETINSFPGDCPFELPPGDEPTDGWRS